MLTTEQRAELETRERSRGSADSRLMASRASPRATAARSGPCSRPVSHARFLAWARRAPRHGAMPWSTRSLGRKLGVQYTIVARARRDAGLQPHRLERDLRSTDPDFETKAADVIGLYLDPPQHAIVSASTRRRRFRRSTGSIHCCHSRLRAQNGTGSSITGTAPRRCIGRSTGRPVRCSATRSRGTPARSSSRSSRRSSRRSHAAGRSTSSSTNLSPHKTQQVRTFLRAHPMVQLHYTPTYSSWLNQVEL